MKVFLPSALLFVAAAATTMNAVANASVMAEVDVSAMMVDGGAAGEPTISSRMHNGNNMNSANDRKFPPSASELLAQKSRRMAEQRARVAEALYNLEQQQSSSSSSASPNNNNDNTRNTKLSWHRMTQSELEQATHAAELSATTLNLKGEEFGANGGKLLRRAQQELFDGRGGDEEGRKLWGNIYSDPYDPAGDLVSEAAYYDKWQQAYRFLGAYIDCTNSKEHGGSHDNNNEQDSGECSRWMIWAAYIDPNYAGGGYDEYFGDGAPGSLDCHSPDTDWKLIGVYRQEFYQYVEQISKHLWAVTDYEYIVARAGLKYMTDEECMSVGYDENGSALYAGVQPVEGGQWQMGLYSDDQCLLLNTKTKYTYDDFVATTELNLGSKDQTNDDAFHSQAYTYWQQTQEYTLTKLNTVYNNYRFCTSCVDYPTYQDGYFIGDDGTDDEDLINQCWKFYSHNSYNCDSDCLAMATEQNSITWIAYNGKQFGTLIDGQYERTHDKSSLGEGGVVTSANGSHRIERLKANLFLTFAGIVFVSTFLAFAVARGSSKKKKSSRSRSRRLLDADYGGSDRDERRSKSRSESRSSRRISGSDRERDRDRGDPEARSSTRAKSRTRSSRSKSQSGRAVGEYEPPPTSLGLAEEKKRRSQSRSKTSGNSSRRVAEM